MMYSLLNRYNWKSAKVFDDLVKGTKASEADHAAVMGWDPALVVICY